MDYTLIGEWKSSNQGFTALATKGGKKYFLKRYNNYIRPTRSPSMNETTFARMSREFDNFMDYRIRINRALAEISGPGGNIIYPTHWFVDGNYYIEATEFIEGLVNDDDIPRLNEANLYSVMLTAATTINAIHKKNIVHSYIKRGNIVVAKTSARTYVAKLLDFDKSYFCDKLPCKDDLGGSQNYMSPELTWCVISEFEESALAKLSTKSDIFSLGILFYNYLAGGDYPKFTDLSAAMTYAGEVLLNDGKLVIEKRKIKEEYLRVLIGNMLHPNPDLRPTAQEVCEVLRSKTVMELRESPQITVEGVKARTAPRPTPTPTPTPSPDPSPRREAPSGFCETWPEHGMAFNIDLIKAKGFVSAERFETAGIKMYKLYTASGMMRPYNFETLKILGWLTTGGSTGGASSSSSHSASSTSTRTSSSGDTAFDGALWPEDSAFTFDIDAVKKAGYADIGKMEKNGIKGYAVKLPSGDIRFFTAATLKMLKFIKSK